MIYLNGCTTRWFAAAGALGFDGFDSGHPLLARLHKWWYRLLGKLDPRKVVVVSKTLTLNPRKGQLTWRFWRSVRPCDVASRSMVNSVQLTGPGIDAWLQRDWPVALRAGVKLMPSLFASSVTEMAIMAEQIRKATGQTLPGVEINACPNLPHEGQGDLLDLFVGVLKDQLPNLPIILKWNYGDAFGNRQLLQGTVRRLGSRVAAHHLINAVPWDQTIFASRTPSPLARYGYNGSVSGGGIVQQARLACQQYRQAGLHQIAPMISGGGVIGHYDLRTQQWTSLYDEVRCRFGLGADAVAFGTAYQWDPAGPDRVMARFGQDPEAVLSVSNHGR